MKKIGIMLLMVCCTCVFTACSDDDDNKNPGLSETITEVVIPESCFAGQEVTITAKGFKTTARLVLENSEKTRIKLDPVFTTRSVSFTVPAELEAGIYSVVLIQDGEEYTLGTLEILLKCLKEIIKIDAWNNTETYALTYGNENRISKIEVEYKSSDGETGLTVYDFKYEGNEITVTGEGEVYVYTLEEGKVKQGTVAYEGEEEEPMLYEWSYNQSGYLTKLSLPDGINIPYVYENGNLVSIEYNELKFANPAYKNNLKSADIVACIYHIFGQAFMSHADFFPHLLGICGNISSHLPSGLGVSYNNAPIDYTWDQDQKYILSASYDNVDTSSEEAEVETTTIKFVYE